MKRVIASLLCVLCLLGGRGFADRTSLEDVAADLLRSRLQADDVADVQAWLDGPLAQAAGGTAEWYVLAFAQQGGYDLAAYQAKLRTYLAEHTVRSVPTRLKYAMTLLASGASVEDPYITAAMAEGLAQPGLMSQVWCLHLMNNGVPATETADAVVDRLLAMQLDDGGWVLTGSTADVDVTAMTMQALAPHRTTRPVVAEALERAVELLSQRQHADGGYASYGVANPESAAQVWMALDALGIDGLTDPRFVKDGTLLDGMVRYRLADGQYSHTAGGNANHNATVQTYLALTAYQRFLAGQGSVFLLDRQVVGGQAGDGVPATNGGYKPIAAAVIAGVAGLGCVVLLLTGKRHWKNFAALGILTALAIAFVAFTDIQSADSYYTAPTAPKKDPIGMVTMSIRCDAVAGRAAYIPEDGVILPETAYPIAAGDTVYTILTEAIRANRIQMENSGGPGMAYVAGMGYLYEQGWGALSGWIYLVNGASSSLGCDQYVLQDGDVVEWVYTLDLGNSPTTR